MTLSEEIDATIIGHSLWRTRLEEAIKSGQTRFSIASIRADDACPFNGWLDSIEAHHGRHGNADYVTTQRLHAEFHNVAGRVVELAIGGRKEDAERVLAREFDFASAKLIEALLAWKASCD